MAATQPPPPLTAATVEVLRRHAPFNAMQPSELDFLAARLKLRYFPKGGRILVPADGIVRTLFIVQRGHVMAEEAIAKAYNATAFTLIEGECFPVGALIGARPTGLVYSAVTDTFCYTLEAADFHALMAVSREFQMFCTRRLAHLLEHSTRGTRESFAGRAAAELGMASPLRTALRRRAVTIDYGKSIREALELMKARRIGSVVVTDAEGRPAGIFTQTDVLDRVALAGKALASPIADVMTREPVRLPATSTVAEAAQAMAQRGFRHLLVMEGEDLAGVISERDLFALQRRSMQGLRKEIAHAQTVEALAFVARDVRGLAGNLLAQGTAAEALMQLVTTLNDAIATRAIELALQVHRVEDIEFAWIGLGSEGRTEQTLATDQDNAIVFGDGAGEGPESVRRRLLPFAGEVNAILDACGFPLCEGDVMARNPKWCLSLGEWKDRFDDWTRNADPQALLNASIFFDFRTLWGEPGLAERLREFLLAQVEPRPAFLRQMAANALTVRPPLGLLGDIVVEDTAGGTLDLKMHASRPFVDAARILALAAGVGATATVERLRQAGPRLRMSADDVATAVDAFLFVQMLRLRLQEEGGYAGTEKNRNRLDPGTLHALDRRILKEALRQARKLQNRIALDYQL